MPTSRLALIVCSGKSIRARRYALPRPLDGRYGGDALPRGVGKVKKQRDIVVETRNQGDMSYPRSASNGLPA